MCWLAQNIDSTAGWSQRETTTLETTDQTGQTDVLLKDKTESQIFAGLEHRTVSSAPTFNLVHI